MRHLLLTVAFVSSLLLFFACEGGDKPAVENETPVQATSLQLIILGGPGAGKGTQAEKITENFQLCHISTGAILRAEVAKGTELGNMVKGVMESGGLVADSIVLHLVEQRLQEADCQSGFILDGFPRTIPQATGLETILQRRGDESIRVLYLEVSDDEMTRRLLGRGRADDTEETIQNRIATFHEQTDPLVEYYQEKGVLIRVNGEQSIEEVAAAVDAVLRK